jgi:hypothetical protein
VSVFHFFDHFPNLFPDQFPIGAVVATIVALTWWLLVARGKGHKPEAVNIGPLLMVLMAAYLAVESVFMLDVAFRPYMLVQVSGYRWYLFIGAAATLATSVVAIRTQRHEQPTAE